MVRIICSDWFTQITSLGTLFWRGHGTPFSGKAASSDFGCKYFAGSIGAVVSFFCFGLNGCVGCAATDWG